MASSEFTLEQIYKFFKDNGGKVKNRDAVRHFKKYLTDPVTKDENRKKFKQYINTLAHTRNEGDDKILLLKTKFLNSLDPASTPKPSPSPQYDPRNSIGIPTSPPPSSNPVSPSTPVREPPPYRAPPPVSSPSPSLDNISLSSSNVSISTTDHPHAPPRKRDSGEKGVKNDEGDEGVSVKERTQKFNRMASTDDELSPRVPKSSEKDRSKSWGSDEDDASSSVPLEPKKCQEWYVTASRGDCQELLKLARTEPRLVNKKDPFTTVLHWGAKYGNAEIIKIFAGKYKVDVNGKTNGGYTPLHISAQFGHKSVFKLLIEVYKADTKIRDYSGRTAEYYLLTKEQKENSGITLRKIKGRKKQSEKDLSFLRIGSLNVRVKKTTEAFSNFLGVGNNASINPASDSVSEKVHKGWGSADNVNKDSVEMRAPKGYVTRKKSKRVIDFGLNGTPKTPPKNHSSSNTNLNNDSDSDTAAGFDSGWKN